ncbi:hypothetical protein NE237_002198 [Protea cynaroides]|uniref:Uncharacterized protein n=1 Tax=Protea cynaroides TaxID=273540 RepID=A0A9Q0KUI3_9MAGN|nr:hypothetical protein NE237_002198 [Protea cynaroides]
MLKPPVPSYTELIPLLHGHDLRLKNHQTEISSNLAFYTKKSSNSRREGMPGSFSFKGRGFYQSGYQPGTGGAGYQSGAGGAGYQSGATSAGYQSGAGGAGYQSGATGAQSNQSMKENKDPKITGNQEASTTE